MIQLYESRIPHILGMRFLISLHTTSFPSSRPAHPPNLFSACVVASRDGRKIRCFNFHDGCNNHFLIYNSRGQAEHILLGELDENMRPSRLCENTIADCLEPYYYCRYDKKKTCIHMCKYTVFCTVFGMLNLLWIHGHTK